MSSKQVQSKISKMQTKFLTAAQLFQQDVLEATTRHGTLTEDMLATIDEKTSRECKYVNLRLRQVFETTTDGLVAPAWGDTMSRQPTTTTTTTGGGGEPQSAKRLVQGAAVAVRGAGSGKKKGKKKKGKKKKAKALPSRSSGVSSRKNAVAVTTFRAKKQAPSEESKTFMIGSYCSYFLVLLCCS